MADIVNAARLALRISTSRYDEEITDLIAAARADLEQAGVEDTDPTAPLVRRAILTYVRANFGEPENYDKLKASYDEQKAQLKVYRKHRTKVKVRCKQVWEGTPWTDPTCSP